MKQLILFCLIAILRSAAAHAEGEQDEAAANPGKVFSEQKPRLTRAGIIFCSPCPRETTCDYNEGVCVPIKDE